MRKSLFIPALIALLTGVSCQVLEDPSGKDDSLLKEIVITGSVGDFTKVTEAGFSNGDVAGLSIGQPVGASNVPITYAGGSFTPSYTLYWAIGQQDSQKADFAACYPYLQDANLLDAFTFTVKTDQSADGAVAASDLLVAHTQASPADQTVKLTFGHALSRILFDIDATDTGAGIQSVVLEGVQTSANVNILRGSAVATGEASVVKAGRDGNFLVAVVAPQTASPAVLITTDKGKQLRYVPDEPLSLVPGKQIVARIVIENDAVVSFITDITPWSTEEVVITNPGPGGETGNHTWTLMVNGYYDDGPSYIEMEPQPDGTYTAVVEGSPYFCLIRDNEQYFGSVLNTNQYDYDLPGFFEDETFELPLILIDEKDIDQDTSHAAKVVNRSTCRNATVTLDPDKYILYFKAVPHQWAPLGKGKFIDGIINGRLIDYPYEEWDVDIQADAACPGTYRIVDPYKNAGWIADNQNFTLEEGGEIVFNINNKYVWISDSYSGLKVNGRSRLFVASLDHNIWWWAGQDFFSGQYDQTNQFISFNGYIAFHLGALGTEEYTGGIYSTNNNNMLSITLPGGTRPVKYDTLENINSWVEENQLLIEFHAGFEVASVEYASVAGIVSAAELPAGTEFMTLPTLLSGQYNSFGVPVINNGTFTVVLKAVSKYGTSTLYTIIKNEAYDRWIGDWDGFEILEKEPGVLVARDGYINGQPLDMPLEFDQSTGNLLYKYAVLDIDYNDYIFFISGVTEDGYYCQDPSVTIATFQWMGDDTAQINPGVYNGSPFVKFGIYAMLPEEGVVDSQEASLPMKISKYTR